MKMLGRVRWNVLDQTLVFSSFVGEGKLLLGSPRSVSDRLEPQTLRRNYPGNPGFLPTALPSQVFQVKM